MKLKRGDKQVFAIVHTLYGPQLGPLQECVWTGEAWAQPGSPAALEVEQDRINGKLEDSDG